MLYDNLAVNTIVKNNTGEVSSCDILYTDDIDQFNRQYLEYTSMVAESRNDRDFYPQSFVYQVVEFTQRRIQRKSGKCDK